MSAGLLQDAPDTHLSLGFEQGSGRPGFERGSGRPGFERGSGRPGFEQGSGRPGFEQGSGRPGFEQLYTLTGVRVEGRFPPSRAPFWRS